MFGSLDRVEKVGQPILAAAGFQPAPPRLFMKFRGPQAHCNRRQNPIVCPMMNFEVRSARQNRRPDRSGKPGGMRRPWQIALAVAACCLAFGQTAWKFEVASVKPAPVDQRGVSATIDPAMVNFRNNNLKNLLMRAYRLRNYQVQGPGWLDSERYDVVAKVPEGAPPDQVPDMLRDLLTARFQLVTHWETRQEDVFVLSVGKNGPRLATSRMDTTRGLGLAPYLVANELESNAGRLRMPGVTVAMFANTLATLSGHPVLDETRIEGVYDISLNVSMSAIRSEAAAAAPDNMQASEPTSTLASTIKELGLNWGTKKAPIEHLVVDSGLKVPIGN